ncbi:MAG: Ig-like domain-containing protein [Candidatus Azobacteroides sp.]|nr:Ig-like domain-containing protein [Candidatus Azobacteroides sp.]
MKRIYLFLCVLLTCSFAFSQLPKAGKKYTIKHVVTGLYMTIDPDETAANVSTIEEYIGDDTQIFELPATSDGYYNMAVLNKYVTKSANNNWDPILGNDPDMEAAKFLLVPEEENIRIKHLVFENSDVYFSPQGSLPGTYCYLNTGLNADDGRWLLQEYIAPDKLEVVHFTPAADQLNVSLNPSVSVLFNMAITASDLTKITIKDEQNKEVANVTASINGFRLNISCSQLEFSTVYTISIPSGTISGYNENLTWSFRTVDPIDIDPEKSYYLRYADTEFYLGRANENQDTRVSLQAKNPDYLLKFVEVEGRPDVYHIIREMTGEYLYQNGYYVLFASEVPGGSTTTVKIENADGYTTIQWIDKSDNNYLGANSPELNANTAADKALGGYIYWSLEEFDENVPLEVSSLTPEEDAGLVAKNTAISVAFNKSIEAADLSGITVIDENNNVLQGIQGEVSGRYLYITYPGELAGYTTYTVTVPAGTIVDYASEISWSFSTANPVLPKEPRLYNIKNVTTGYYLTYPETAPATESLFMVAEKIDGEGSERQEFRFLNTVPEKPDVFSIAVFSGEYIKREEGSSKWPMTIAADEISEFTTFNFIAEGDELKIEVVANENQGLYLGVNDQTTYVCYLDKWSPSQIYWILEPVDEPIDIYRFTPSANAVGVLRDADIQATFNQSVKAIDLSLIAIKDQDGNAVEGVVATLEDYILTIEHDGFEYGKTYTVTIPAGTIEDLTEELSWSFSTREAPSIRSTTPAKDATGVDIGNLVIEIISSDPILDENFDGISIEDASGNAISTGTISATNNTLSVPVSDMLEYNTSYTVTILAGTITDIDEYSWTFITGDVPHMISTSPVDGATEIKLTAAITVSFDKTIYEEDFSAITLKDASGEEFQDAINKSGSRLNISKKTLEYNTTYTVTIPANSIKGVTEEITFSFTTEKGLGIGDAEENSVAVYPVVSRGNVTVRTPGDASLSVVDISGNKLAMYETKGLLDISLDYPNGLYLILIESKEMTSSHKIILQK